MTTREIEAKKIEVNIAVAELIMNHDQLMLVSDIVNSYEKILIKCDEDE